MKETKEKDSNAEVDFKKVERVIKQKLKAYWTAKQKERLAKELSDGHKAEILELAGQIPLSQWNGGTLRFGVDVIRMYTEDKLEYPGKFDKIGFIQQNREYVVLAEKINESLLVDRLKDGSEYLEGLGLRLGEKKTTKIEKL